jgi:SAM-dependent methyltransferase
MEHDAYIEMAATEAAHWWFVGRRQILAAVIGRLNLAADARILELGSGTGGNFQMLQRFGRVTAVETNALARQLSVRNAWGMVEVKAGYLPDGLPELGKFDLICLFDVLEHVAADEAALDVVHGLLAPGGSVVITVPAFAKLWGLHDEQMHHHRRYERAELAAKLHHAGFAVRSLSYSNMFLFPAALAMRGLDRLAQRFSTRRKSSGAGMLPAPINRVFAAIFGAERFLVGRVRLPFGLSLLAVIEASKQPLFEPSGAKAFAPSQD